MNKQELLNRMENINFWIRKNPQVKEPNMYELIDCVTRLGIIARQEGVAKKENKFPEFGSELAVLYSEWNKMYKSRMSYDIASNPEFSVNNRTNLYAYFTDLNMRCCTGEFTFPGMDVDEAILSDEERGELFAQREEFLEAVRKIGSISLYINQEKQHNPDFVYDNQTEYEELIQKVGKYKEYMPKHYEVVISDIGDNMVISAPNNPGGNDDPSL